MNVNRVGYYGIAALLSGLSMQAGAADFMVGDTNVSWNSQIIAGGGIRTQAQSCSTVGGPDGTAGCSAGGNPGQGGNGSMGDLNYNKDHFYSAYLKGTTELLLSNPDGYKFMFRDTFIYDQGAANSNTPLSNGAKDTVAPNNLVLDLWVSKNYVVDEQSGHWRFGNQVLNWGESTYALGGIAATNAFDIQKLYTPGVQLKEAVLPAPMFSVAQGLGNGWSTEAYYQFGWNHDRFPAPGTFWSTFNGIGPGFQPFYTNPNNYNIGTYPSDPNAVVTGFGPEKDPKNSGQWGLSLHYKPPALPLNLAAYALNYHDKTPNLESNSSGLVWDYVPNRRLYGLSANLPVGYWAIGAETSYRPHDAVSLTGCFSGTTGGQLDANNNTYAGPCHQWVDEKKYQTSVTAQLNMIPSNFSMLNSMGADMAVLTIEGVMVNYPGVSNNGLVTSIQGGQKVVQGYDASLGSWLNGSNPMTQTTASVGTSNSEGVTVDFNWTYDGTVVPGWQVNPGVTFFGALHGYTPNFLGQYLQGQKSLNFYTYFNQNPATWQAGINFTRFFGGNQISQPFGDRSNVGFFLTRNF